MSESSLRDRRRGERLVLSPPIRANLSGHPVDLHEISLLGGRIECDSAVASHGQDVLRLPWEGEEIVLDCSIARSERLSQNGAGDRYSFGLSFRSDGEKSPRLQRMLAAISAGEEVERLKRIVEASKLINSSIEADTLFQSILGVARQELHVERGTLYFVDEAKGEIWSKIADGIDVREIRLPMGKGLAGTVAATGEPVILYDAYADPRFDQSLDLKSGFRTRSMLCVPIRNRDGRVVGVLQLLNKRVGSFGARDLEFLAAISEHMAIAMENATLHMEILEKNRMERELQLGREIQGRLLPQPPCDIEGVDLAAVSFPCFEVGGDYYDFIEFADGDLGLAIADVSGKGVSAAMIMSSFQAALRVAAPMEESLASLMNRLNALLYRMAGGRKYVTFFFGRFSPATGELRYVNAGHNPPFIVGEGSCREISSTGRPVGLLPSSRFEEGRVTVPPGSTLFLYTDGLNESETPAGEEFGMDRLRDLVCASANGDAAGMASRVLSAIAQFEKGAHANDDKTVVVLRRDRSD